MTSSEGVSDIPPSHTEAAHLALQCHVARHSDNIQRRAHLACELHREWETYARSALWAPSVCCHYIIFLRSKLTAEYRRLNKEANILTRKLLSLEEEQKQQVLARYVVCRPPLLSHLPLLFSGCIFHDSTPQRHPSSGNEAKDDRVVSLTIEIADKQRTARIDKVSTLPLNKDISLNSIRTQRLIVYITCR